MLLSINEKKVEVQTGETLLELLKRLNLDDGSLHSRPLAASVAGEVFNLNYIPQREKESDPSRPPVRRAMAAANGEIELLRYSDPAGKEAYIRSAMFVVFLALHQLWPQVPAKISCTLGSSVFISLTDPSVLDLNMLKTRMRELVSQDIPLIRHRVPMEDALERFEKEGRRDKTRLLKWQSLEYFDEYTYGDYGDYFYGEMVPSTSYLTVWDILPADGGLLFLFPDDIDPEKVYNYQAMPHFFDVYAEGERWGELMECENVADLNERTANGTIRELIRVNEALHEKKFSQIADAVTQRGAKLVLLAGPSSSGKTTSANRLATQLRVYGKKPILMSLDDYYLNRDQMVPGPDGTIDFEHINTIDTALFRQHMQELLSGKSVRLPVFNFLTGKREWSDKELRLEAASVMIVEGLHALNPVMLPEGLEDNLVFRLYVSPLLPLNLDNHNRIPTSQLRLLRRTVRDYLTRGSSVQRTLSMWDSVRRGEARWIFPYQEHADVIFNSSTLYELAVLKKHIYPLLLEVDREDEYYKEVRNITKLLSCIQDADVDDEIPPTSLVREFIGGNSFYR